MTNDVKAALVLTTLYVIQGIPIGLIWGSMSSILSENSSYSYSQQAIFTLTYYPYSLKLLWSPLVDSLSLPGIGRRKSWVFASQTVMALLLFYIGYNIETWIQQMGIYSISIWSFFLILSTATQDIAVDGLSLTMLSRENVSYQSLAQSFGINMGYAIAFPMLLTFKISLPLFMYISGFIIILCINYTICYWLNRLHCGDQKVMMVIYESISSAVHAANRRRKQQMECLPATMMLNWNQKSILPQVQPSRRLPKRRFEWFSAQRLVCEKVDKIYESSRPL